MRSDGWVQVGVAMALLAAAGAQAGPAMDDAALMQAAVAQDADDVVEMLRDLVNGHGGPGGISADAMAGAVQLARAEARAGFLRRVQAVDLDWDGQVTPQEISLASDAASASGRARLLRLVERVDTDGDGTLSGAELATAAAEAALRAFPPDRADLARAAMVLDADGNGLLALDEVKAGVARLADTGDGA